MTKQSVNSPRSSTVFRVNSELRQAYALRCWQEKLQAIESVFARLIFVSWLRDSSGRYVDPYLNRVCSPRICHQIVADAHLQIFRNWLQISARSKLSDIRKYQVTLCSKSLATERIWSEFCRDLVPSGISITELALFFGTMKRLRYIVVAPNARSRPETRETVHGESNR